MITYPKHISVSDAARKYLKTNFVVLTKGDGNAPAVIIDKNNSAINEKEIDLFSDENSSLKNSTNLFKHYKGDGPELDKSIIQDFRISKYVKCLNPLCLIRHAAVGDKLSIETLYGLDSYTLHVNNSSKYKEKYLLIAPQEVALQDKLCELGYSISKALANDKFGHIMKAHCDDPTTNYIKQEIIDRYPEMKKHVNLFMNTALKIKFVKAAEAFGQIPVLVV